MAARPSRILITPEARLSFCNVIVAKEFKDKNKGNVGTGKFSYITDLIIKPDDIKKFRMLDTTTGNVTEVDFQIALRDLALEAWGTSINPDTSKPWTVKEMFAGVAARGWPLKNGDVIAAKAKAQTPPRDYDQYLGMKALSIKSNVSEKTQPPILSQQLKDGKRTFNRTLPGDMEIAKQLFQGGNYAFAEINVVANEVSGMKYLTCYVNSLRYTREGTKFGRSGDDLMDRFGGVGGGESDHNPLEGSDEIPF